MRQKLDAPPKTGQKTLDSWLGRFVETLESILNRLFNVTLYGSVSITVPQIPANSSIDVSVAILGVDIGDTIHFSIPTVAQSGTIIGGSSVSGSGSAIIRFANVTASLIPQQVLTMSYSAITRW